MMEGEIMGEIREIFDVKQNPLKYGKPTPLEDAIVRIEQMFSDIYESDFISGYGIHSWGFKTKQGTRFVVNGIYEWNTVFLEYDDGEDGDMVSLNKYSETEAFNYLNHEILVCELDDQMEKENAFRIYKTEQSDQGLAIYFRFWDTEERIAELYSRKNVLIDGISYEYTRHPDSIQAIIIQRHIDDNLFDHWIKFI